MYWAIEISVTLYIYILYIFLPVFFSSTGLDKIRQRAFAEYHSKGNFVERTHAAENDALLRHLTINKFTMIALLAVQIILKILILY